MCPYCKTENAGTIHKCPKCNRKGCAKCMPEIAVDGKELCKTCDTAAKKAGLGDRLSAFATDPVG